MEERFETFTVLINRISRNIRKLKNQEMADEQLRSVHISCLYYLHAEEGLTAARLCQRCEEDKATISRALDHLEQEGYLTCPIQSGKRYNAPLVLTEKGQKTAKKISGKIDRVLEEISDSMTEQERLAFYRCLSRISLRLEEVTREGDI